MNRQRYCQPRQRSQPWPLLSPHSVYPTSTAIPPALYERERHADSFQARVEKPFPLRRYYFLRKRSRPVLSERERKFDACRSNQGIPVATRLRDSLNLLLSRAVSG